MVTKVQSKTHKTVILKFVISTRKSPSSRGRFLKKFTQLINDTWSMGDMRTLYSYIFNSVDLTFLHNVSRNIILNTILRSDFMFILCRE